MTTLEHSERDRTQVEGQLGRPLRGRWSVARRCHLGVPMVIENHPIGDDGAPFPTLFWLTCPMLVKRTSKQEATGRMRALNEALAASEGARERVDEAVARLVRRRDSHAMILDPGPPPGGGPNRIKCLHAHVAQELADPPNPVGAVVLAQVGWPDCRVPCVEGAG
ncbi:MAG: DUF501 domain-containing protein [Actinomycetota bacterium]|nr:DUF501 domain-containing protein [Actinomycetota bacterium]